MVEHLLEKITQVSDILMIQTRDAFIPPKPFNLGY
jgi:hypothetical protein